MSELPEVSVLKSPIYIACCSSILKQNVMYNFHNKFNK